VNRHPFPLFPSLQDTRFVRTVRSVPQGGASVYMQQVRLDNGFPTTEEEKQEFDRKQVGGAR
jgi:hypothetical protein